MRQKIIESEYLPYRAKREDLKVESRANQGSWREDGCHAAAALDDPIDSKEGEHLDLQENVVYCSSLLLGWVFNEE